MKQLIAILTLNAMLFVIRANANTYYVSPTGNDSNPGTMSQPFASWQKLSSVLHAGDIAYIRGGTYRTPKAIGKGNYPVDWRNFNGTSSAHITVSAYPGESPVLNCDNIVETTFMLGFYLGNCSYIDFKGLRITGLKQNPSTQNAVVGWYIDICNQVTFTQCEVDHIQGPGYRVTQATPVSNVITFTNCDAHHNGDPYNTGGGVYGNADGFDANGGTVTYIGCRAWWNSDDGFDTFYNDAQITYTNCWSFWNGFIPGTFTDPGSQADGTGFKWGATTSDLRTTHLRTFTNCIAFQNKTWGFTQNAARCIAWFYNNTSYQNGFKNQSSQNGTGGGWATGFSISPPVAIVMKNNISYSDPMSVNNLTGLVQDHNTWNNLAASNSSFASLDTTGVTKARQSDGSPPVLQFLHLSANSNMINAGVSISGLSFSGSAPDLGAFEYSTSSSTNQITPPSTSGLTGSGVSSSATINLTTEGSSDWAHWSGYDHKSSGGSKISNYTAVGTGTVSNYNDDPRTCTWSDGTPTASGSNKNGIYITGIGKGFQITAPADLTQRTLKVYVGGWISGGALTASLSDGSAADYFNSSFSGTGQYNAVYTLTYKAASAGKLLTVKWVQASGAGNVTIQAATLVENTSGSTTQSVATPEAIDENSLTEKPSFTIYPNPVRDNFILQLNNSHMGKMNVQLVNQAGAIVRTYVFNKDQIVNQITVPAHDLPTGVYFVHVEIGSWGDQRKIVKLKN